MPFPGFDSCLVERFSPIHFGPPVRRELPAISLNSSRRTAGLKMLCIIPTLDSASMSMQRQLSGELSGLVGQLLLWPPN